MHDLARELYPLCRSITGDGVRETLKIIGRELELAVYEVPTGTPVLDWTVPKEWNIRDAWVKNSRGEKVIDFKQSNLHVVGYSVPVRARMTLTELAPHLFSLPDRPDWIPNHNSFYKEDWGFCLRHEDLQALPDGEYDVCIDSTLADGSLTYAEAFIPGSTTDELLLCSHMCHPSMCNDNLSGISLLTLLGRYLAMLSPRYSYRLLFLPVTIGSITWLARNEANLGRIKHGLVVALVGDDGPTTYKKSRRGDAPIDRAFAHVLKQGGPQDKVIDFVPDGYDERQFCSPGFNLPVGCLMRTPYGQFPEYHTSGDDLDFIKPLSLADSLRKALAALDVLEHDRRFLNLNPRGEPQLGRRGIFHALSERTEGEVHERALLWVLNFSDGVHTLLDIAERSGISFIAVQNAAEILVSCGLLKEAAEGGAQ
jgi:aminopeptidase-like protein